MVGQLILSIREASVTFGVKPLFEDLSFNIHENDKICVVGKNGAGKTTMMQLISGERELDTGERWQTPGLHIGYLQQDVPFDGEQTVGDFIFDGLQEDRKNDDYLYMIDMMTVPLELNKDDKLKKLSGGQMRRAALARSLVEEPNILMLDEPTNHLDLSAIEWLEEYLQGYRGTLLCISHDKTFLSNISDKVFWLDRGKVRVCPQGYGHFDEWSQMMLEQEERELAKRSKLVSIEVEWASRGVKARRKRNMKRVADMKSAREKLKSDKSSFNKIMRKIDLEPLPAEKSSKVMLEFHKVSKKFKDDTGEKIILDQFSMRVMRGDRIGILGHNGSGKTSFLKMVTKQMDPDMGKIKLARNAEIAYFDQRREGLKLDKSMWKNLCGDGGEFIDVGGKKRHVCGYLKDFMFDPKSAQDLVSTLSGGQKNRLMLAKVLANPGNFMILDEPTNDLDMDTLEMLEEIVANYKGTLFVVSHDRDFLDQTVSEIIAFEGNGEVKSYLGGYSDYLAERNKNSKNPAKTGNESKKKSSSNKKKIEEKKPAKKLSYKIQFELDSMPKKIESLTSEIASLHDKLGQGNLYMEQPEEFDKLSKRVSCAEKERDVAEIRWIELMEIAEE